MHDVAFVLRMLVLLGGDEDPLFFGHLCMWTQRDGTGACLPLTDVRLVRPFFCKFQKYAMQCRHCSFNFVV